MATSLTSAPITVIVGTEETFLVASSDFFKNAIKPVWKSMERTITLPDISPVAFRMYADWLYTGHIGFVKTRVGSSTDIPVTSDAHWTTWRQCYDLGNFVLDIDFKDAVIDAAIDRMTTEEEYIDHMPNLIYAASSQNSPYRKLAVDIAVKAWIPQTFTDIGKAGYCVEFLADLGTALAASVRTGGVIGTGVHDLFKDLKDTCKYHEHTVTKAPCYKTKRPHSA